MSWHDPSCQLDLRWHNGTPGCTRCGLRAPNIAATKGIPPTPPPPSILRSQLKCSWPPRVRYGTDLDLEDCAQFIRDNIDSWKIGDSSEDSASSPSKKVQETIIGHEPDASLMDLASSEPTQLDIYGRLPERDSIRLLRLHGSASPQDPVHCSLELVRLNEPELPIFEALSYTWADLDGNSELICPIYLGSDYQVLLITKNCLSALRQLRAPTDRLIWVDAICINQGDVSERGHQVALMRNIYSAASRVLVYLGEQGSKTDTAMSLLKCGASPATEQEFAAVRQLMGRPYFRRLWVVQEVKLAHKASITCGGLTGHWSGLRAFVDLPHLMSPYSLGISWVHNKSSSLFHLLRDTEKCECGDPRDKVFALLGLVEDSDATGLPIDYTLSIQEIYIGIASYLLQVTGYVGFLDSLGGSRQVKNLPSWVPDGLFFPEEKKEPFHVEIALDLPPDAVPEPLQEFGQPIIPFTGWHHSNVIAKSILEGHQNMRQLQILSETASLVLSGFPIFSVARGKLSITCGPSDPLHLPQDEVTLPNLGNPADGEDFVCYLVPALERTLLLKPRGHQVFSLHSHCSFGVGQVPKGKALSPLSRVDVAHRITQSEREIMLRWILMVFFLGIRSSSPAASEERAFSTPWFSSFPAVCEELAYQHCRRIAREPGCGHYFSSMNAMRDEVLGALSDDDLLALRHLRGHRIWPEQATYGVRASYGILSPFSGSTDDGSSYQRILLNQIESIQSTWNSYNASADVLLPQWKSAIQVFKKSMERHGRIADIIDGLRHSGHEPVWTFLDEQRRSDFESSVVDKLLQPIPGLRCRFFNFYEVTYTRTSPATIVYQGWELIKSIPLDSAKSWEWNRDRFRIYLATLQMVAQMKALLWHRQILSRVDEVYQHPERIVIV
ncbi:HET-domain-containing protein [Trematosphaeria pertusa]|uniref:HET-domain-containing protein n=1 Tax=Trematosphaeria pertusa TaxID=390896 RepID=A0A6A6IFE6_9PLEO|nr:HET-domain-containing protein [Trematosphaeria pertusa]KAF2248250.1 HET-domain-containing protein [Trematosphaeria pertusa]